MHHQPRFCTQCGAALGVDAQFCRQCGGPVAANTAHPAMPASASQAGTTAPSPTTVVAPIALWRTALAVMSNPRALLRAPAGPLTWPWALGISGLAFALFFLQTGMDRVRNGSMDAGGAALLGMVGLLCGSLGVGLLALIAWAIARLAGGTQRPDWAVRAFGLGYSPALLYAICGLCANLLLGWNTAIAFGVTGVLWAMGPLLFTLRTLCNGKLALSMLLTTVCGGGLLFGWALLGTGW